MCRIPNGEASVDDVQLVSDEAKLILHARDIGVGEVAAIELGEVRKKLGKEEDQQQIGRT